MSHVSFGQAVQRPQRPTASQDGAWKVVVGNVSRHATDHSLADLFSTSGVLQGSTLHYPARHIASTGFAELLFASQDEALAAGKLTGWALCNELIVVSPPEFCPDSYPPHSQLNALRAGSAHLPLSPPAASVSASASGSTSPTTSMGRYHLPSPYDPRRSNIIPTTAEHASAGDWAESSEPSAVERKNLYVLNLPLDMTNEEMLGLFQPFGTVVHACILAILDSSARRRGFILMGSGVEATAAMRNLHGQVYRDYVLDVSYSVVQKTSSQRNLPDPSGAGPSSLNRPPGRSALTSSRAQPPASHYDALRALGQPIGRIAGAADGDDPRDFWSGLPGAAAAAAASGVGGVGGSGTAYLQQGSSNSSHEHQQQQQQQMAGKSAWDARRPKRIITNGNGGGEVGLLVDNLSPVVFHTADDVEALFASFGAAGTGAVRSVDLFPSLLEDRPNAAVVRFAQRADAERAKRSLEGRSFVGREIRLSILESAALAGVSGSSRPPLSAAANMASPTIPAETRDSLSGLPFRPATSRIGGNGSGLTPTRPAFVPLAGQRSTSFGSESYLATGSTLNERSEASTAQQQNQQQQKQQQQQQRASTFDPFSSPFGPATSMPLRETIHSPPLPQAPPSPTMTTSSTGSSRRPVLLAKDTVELCHPLPTDLSALTGAFPPPPHSFSDTLTPRPHYSSPPPAAPKHAHEGGLGHLRTPNLSAFAHHRPSTAAAATDESGGGGGGGDSDLAFSDGSGSTADGSFDSPGSSLGRSFWRRSSSAMQPLHPTAVTAAASSGGPIVVGSSAAHTGSLHEKTASGSGYSYFHALSGPAGDTSGGDKDAEALSNIVIGTSLSDAL